MSSLVSMIVAMACNRVIGRDNQLPWHLPEDLKHFKRVTMGKPIVMGRKTYDSIGRPLPGRRNIVVTRQQGWSAPGVDVVHKLESALELARESAVEVVVIGGAGIYQQALPFVDRIYLTCIHQAFEGDALFPELDKNRWSEVERQDVFPSDGNELSYSFVTLERR